MARRRRPRPPRKEPGFQALLLLLASPLLFLWVVTYEHTVILDRSPPPPPCRPAVVGRRTRRFADSSERGPGRIAEGGGGTTVRAPEVGSSATPSYDIVRGAYRDTYALLERCPGDVPPLECLSLAVVGGMDSNGTGTGTSTAPWWFRTLLRDASDPAQYLRGPWHNLKFVDPPLRFCAIEKVASKQWRRVGCRLDNQTTMVGKSPCSPRREFPSGAPRVTFLRDPLERFLSAFIDKCILWKEERHCEPRAVFLPEREGDSLTDGLDGDNRLLFDAYVDAMPLKWNVHFFPLSLYCDGLYRSLGGYDFVGNMGANFYKDLHRMGERYGERMMYVLNSVFGMERKLNMTNYGRESSASSHVKKFFSPRTVRRLLEYFSVDYMTLNLTVPDWANEILLQDG